MRLCFFCIILCLSISAKVTFMPLDLVRLEKGEMIDIHDKTSQCLDIYHKQIVSGIDTITGFFLFKQDTVFFLSERLIKRRESLSDVFANDSSWYFFACSGNNRHNRITFNPRDMLFYDIYNPFELPLNYMTKSETAKGDSYRISHVSRLDQTEHDSVHIREFNIDYLNHEVSMVSSGLMKYYFYYD
jgi:hypothetical protein